MTDTMRWLLNRIEAMLPMGAFVLVRLWMALVLLTWQLH